MMKKVTGLGGVFFKAKDPAALQAWYEQHLGLKKSPFGVLFGWRPFDKPGEKACTLWTPFKESTDYFGSGDQSFMINYRVENLEALLAELQAAGVTMAGEMQTYDYGKFGWIIDPEGRKIELWEPIGGTFGDMAQEHSIY
ncbi:VOC family protein [Flaviaesturariibacter aridisoli]|uniref:VOC family protein n=2 Tax=Flaviaesturariibacter aridisoli TaxID=2545761 RepID=A0A4R4E2H0_9BACT|nr:VOC family protein [Flaviaesturariibacter aridisoli]